MAATPGRLPATSSAPRAPHQLFEFKQQVTGSGPPEQVWTRGIVVGDWTVRVTHGSIANAGDIDALTDKLGIPPPEMPFLHNSLILEHAPSGFSYCFDAARALQCVDGVRTEQQLTPIQYSGTPTADPPVRPKRSLSRSGIQVAYAKEWGQSRRAALAAQGDLSAQLTSTKQYDWTYSSTWPGMPGAEAPDIHHWGLPVKTAWVDAFHPGTDPMRDRIPVERLGVHGEPILFYDEVVLYEDELGDNGSSLLSVKVRVMPSSLLVLQRFFLRVDHVVFRLFDTRLFVSFDTSDVSAHVPRVIRECRGMQVPYSDVQQCLPPHRANDLSLLTQVAWVAEAMERVNARRKPSEASERWEGEGACVHVALLPSASSTPGAASSS